MQIDETLLNFLKFILQILTYFVFPFLVIGVISRTKAIWAGRKGPPLNQFFFDLVRLCRKTPVFSDASSWIFQVSPWIFLGTTLVAVLMVPWVPGYSPLSFSYDFIYFAYLLGLGRVFLMIAALDTGSSFEGMGASREATFSAFAEPLIFFAMGTLGMLSDQVSLQSLFLGDHSDILLQIIRALLIIILFVFLQVEAGRIPVDDPTTHLELTMIHEVMILDYSGPELAAIQYGSALKMALFMGFIAALINPFAVSDSFLLSWAASCILVIIQSMVVGLVESIIARLQINAVPIYIAGGTLIGIISFIVTQVYYAWHGSTL